MSNIIPVFMMMNHKWTKEELKQSKKLTTILGALILVLGILIALLAYQITQEGVLIGSIVISIVGAIFLFLGEEPPINKVRTSSMPGASFNIGL